MQIELQQNTKIFILEKGLTQRRVLQKFKNLYEQ